MAATRAMLLADINGAAAVSQPAAPLFIEGDFGDRDGPAGPSRGGDSEAW